MTARERKDASNNDSLRVVVIGGGFSGLASAALLGREGHQVTLLEARSSLGGRAGEWRKNGFRWDTGPSWYLMPEVFEHFFALCGTSVERELDLVDLDPGYRVFFEEVMEPFDLPRGHEREALIRLGADPERISEYLNSAAETFELAVNRLLYSTFASGRSLLNAHLLRRLPRLMRLLFQRLDRFIGAQVKESRTQKILSYPAVFLGTSPAQAPSMYHLLSHLDLHQGVRYPRGGFTSVVEAVARMARQNGAQLRTGVQVQRILTEQGKASGVEFADVQGHLHRLPADVVVSSADMHLTEKQLLTPEYRTRSERSWRRRDPGPGAVLAMLGVAGELPELAHHSLFFTEDWTHGFKHMAGKAPDPGPPRSLYLCRPSATDEQVAPAGHENLFLLVPVAADPGLGFGGEDGEGDAAVERIVDESIAQISDWAGIPDLSTRIVVRRSLGPADFERDFGAWRGGALGPSHRLGQSAFLRGPISSPRLPGLFYTGATTMPGVGVPMCLISAELVVKALRGDHSAAPMGAAPDRFTGAPNE